MKAATKLYVLPNAPARANRKPLGGTLGELILEPVIEMVDAAVSDERERCAHLCELYGITDMAARIRGDQPKAVCNRMERQRIGHDCARLLRGREGQGRKCQPVTLTAA